MTSLTSQQTNCLRQHLRQVGTPDLLVDELVDYLAYQTEELMNGGASFEKALSIIRQEATSLAIRHLHQRLIRQGVLASTEFGRNPYHSLKRATAVHGFIQPVRSTLLVGAFLNVMLTGWLLASKSLAIPVGLVATLLCPLLLLLFLQLLRSMRIQQGAILIRHTTWREELMLRPFSRRSALTRALPLSHI